MKTLLRSASVLALASLALASHAAFYDFESVDLGETTPGDLTDDGITASFSASPGEADFSIADASDPEYDFATLTGHVLVEAETTSSTLTIDFDRPLGAFSTLFAASSDDPLDLSAYLGGILVGTTAVAGVSPGGGRFPEGRIGFAGAAFDRVTLRLRSDENAFAVDDVSVQAVPEPTTIAALGLGALGMLRRRKQS